MTTDGSTSDGPPPQSATDPWGQPLPPGATGQPYGTPAQPGAWAPAPPPGQWAALEQPGGPGQWGAPGQWAAPEQSGAPGQWGAPGQSGQAPPTWGPPGAWGPDPTGAYAPPRTSAWAVVALVAGILGLVPVAVVAGAVALVQLRGDRTQTGQGLAVGGLVAAALWTLVVIAVVVGVVRSGGLDEAFRPESQGRVADAGATTIGTCLDEPRSGTAWSPTDCASRHDAEIYLAPRLDGEAWPGTTEVAFQADDACLDAFEDYVGRGYVQSDFDYGFFAPERPEWDAGEQQAVCVVLPFEDRTLTGSVEDSGR